jgi:type IV secretory pathway protease TraF
VFLAITFGALFALMHLRLNESLSEPLGLYRPTHEALKRNRLVLLRDPLKRLVGLPGDRIRPVPRAPS